MANGTRTRDHRDHNPGLYQLSYRHLAVQRIATSRGAYWPPYAPQGPVAQWIERQASNLRAEVQFLPGPFDLFSASSSAQRAAVTRRCSSLSKYTPRPAPPITCSKRSRDGAPSTMIAASVSSASASQTSPCSSSSPRASRRRPVVLRTGSNARGSRSRPQAPQGRSLSPGRHRPTGRVAHVAVHVSAVLRRRRGLQEVCPCGVHGPTDSSLLRSV